MSAVMNVVILAGRLTRDPELRSTPKGTPVAHLGLAVPRIGSAQNGSEEPPPCFVEVTVWGHLAEVCQKHLRKGAPVLVQGSLALDRWEGKDGDRRQQLRVVAQRVQFLGTAPRSRAGTEETRPGRASGATPSQADAEARPRGSTGRV